MKKMIFGSLGLVINEAYIQKGSKYNNIPEGAKDVHFITLNNKGEHVSYDIHHVKKHTPIKKVITNLGLDPKKVIGNNTPISSGAAAATKMIELQSRNPKSGWYRTSSWRATQVGNMSALPKKRQFSGVVDTKDNAGKKTDRLIMTNNAKAGSDDFRGGHYIWDS